MHPKLTQSIQYRLLVYSSILLMVSIASLSYINISRETNSMKEELKNRAKLVIGVIEKSICDNLYDYDSDKVADTLKAITQSEGIISSGKVYSEKGILISDAFSDTLTYSSKPDPMAQEMLKRKELIYVLEGKELIAGKAVILGRRPIGVIKIGLPTQALNDKIWALTLESITIGFLSVVISIFVCYFLSAGILKPLSQLHDAVGKMSEGDYSSKIEVFRNDEIGDLSKAFNQMQSNLKSTYLKLMDSEERYALAVRGANDGIWDWNLVTGAIYLSPRWHDIFGLPYVEDHISTELWFQNIHPDDRSMFHLKLDEYIGGASDSFELEYRIVHVSQEIRWVFTSGFAVREDQTLKCLRIVGCITDITEKKMFEQELTKTAFFDPLTSLPNRRMLLEKITDSLHRYARDKTYLFAVMFLDFDGFKHVNDTYGHATGDLLLVSISQRIKKCVRPMDCVARVGGDEFVIILDNIPDVAMIETVVTRIQERVGEEYLLSGHSIFISVSIGIVTNEIAFHDGEELIQNADTAMYYAKMNGKAQHCFFDLSMKSQVQEKWHLDNLLRKAIEKNELRVYYHPLMRNDGKSILGFEALVRWIHPEKGFIPPGLFIPTAEESGYITELTKWIVDEVTRFAVNVSKTKPLTFFVNVSARDFNVSGGVVQTVKESLERHKCSPKLLGLEVTERTLIGNFEHTRTQLLELKQMGVRIELDDFGTGYSSLNYLHQFPLNGIKLDKSFIDTVTQNKASENIVAALITMAHNLELTVVAEGVETIEQQEHLVKARCDYLQGFLFTKPMPEDDVLSFIASVYNQNTALEKIVKN